MNANDSHSKQDSLRLIAHIKEHASSLKSVLWSQEELMSNKEFLNSASQKINDMVELIEKNFYWYQKIGWKSFLLDPEQVEKKAFEEAILEEKDRFRDWLAASTPGPDFYYAFHHQIPEEFILSTMAMHGFQEFKERAVLDVGCRTGFWLQKFLHLGIQPENLAGVEPCDHLWASASQALDGQIQVVHGYPDELPFEDHRFDVVLMFGILMNVLDEHLQRKIGMELLRVLSSNGMIITVNASEQFLAGLEPYIAYTTQVLNLGDMHVIFPECNVQLQSSDTFTLAVITRDSNQEEGEIS